MNRATACSTFAIAAAFLLPGALAAQGEEELHRQEVEQWRDRRIAALTRDTGWLTLTGLHRLEPGRQILGSAEDSSIRLTEAAPSRLGVLTVGADGLYLEVAPGVEVTIDGDRIESTPLRSDVDGDPTLVEIGTLNYHVIERGGVLWLRGRDREHSARRAFTGIDSFPVSLDWRLQARFVAYEPPRQIPVANVLGQVNDATSWGALEFQVGDAAYRLDVLAEPGDEELFIIFGDATSGHETYGAGRYLYTPAPDDEGRVTIDFNRAYNPPCAFTAFATCPLPPPQNRLDLRIEAGEKSYASSH